LHPAASCLKQRKDANVRTIPAALPTEKDRIRQVCIAWSGRRSDSKASTSRGAVGFVGWSQIMTAFLAQIVFEKQKTDRRG
jgi:hypothetical protein